MLMVDLKKLVNAAPEHQVYEDRDGTLIPWGDGMNVNLTGEPHFAAIPVATMFG